MSPREPSSPASIPLPEPESGGPLALYRARQRAGALLHDPAQGLAAEKLQSLWRALANYHPGCSERGWRARLGLTRRTEAAPAGLYIFGDVGRGKSMLMEIFFATAPVERKRRVHFFAFMQEVHKRIFERRRDKGDPIVPVAQAIAAEATLLCFDEFQVTDIADAMILGRLFTALFAAGVVVVATSNRAPDELYAGGLNRERFLPFIALLKEQLDVLELEGARDYRLARGAGAKVYFSPADDAARDALEAAFAALTGNAAGARGSLPIQGRSVDVPRAARGVAWFTFEELCVRPLGPVDYLALCTAYRTVILEGIPQLGPEQRNEARRFNIFIDALYETRGHLIASAAVPPQEIYRAGDGAFEFARTVSRLMEMQSADYLAAPGGGSEAE